MSLEFTSSEMMSVTAARALTSEMTCFVGIGLPSEAANLARLTHAPDITLIYESGTLQTRPDVLPLSIGFSGAAETGVRRSLRRFPRWQACYSRIGSRK